MRRPDLGETCSAVSRVHDRTREGLFPLFSPFGAHLPRLLSSPSLRVGRGCTGATHDCEHVQLQFCLAVVLALVQVCLRLTFTRSFSAVRKWDRTKNPGSDAVCVSLRWKGTRGGSVGSDTRLFSRGDTTRRGGLRLQLVQWCLVPRSRPSTRGGNSTCRKDSDTPLSDLFLGPCQRGLRCVALTKVPHTWGATPPR